MRIILAIALVAVLGISIGTANADLIIAPNGGEQDRISDAGGTTGTGNPGSQPPQGNGLPTLGVPGTVVNGLTGYNSLVGPSGPSLTAVTAGDYLFTYMGSGNAANLDRFTITDSHGTTCTFTNNAGGGGTAPGTTCLLFFDANTDLAFTYTNVTAGTSVSDDSHAADISYFLGVDNSTHCNNTTDPLVTCDNLGNALTGPAQFGYIGLSDLPPTGDHDFQDLGVRVDEVAAPEPASLMLLGSALVGFGVFRRRRKVSR